MYKLLIAIFWFFFANDWVHKQWYNHTMKLFAIKKNNKALLELTCKIFWDLL